MGEKLVHPPLCERPEAVHDGCGLRASQAGHGGVIVHKLEVSELVRGQLKVHMNREAVGGMEAQLTRLSGHLAAGAVGGVGAAGTSKALEDI